MGRQESPQLIERKTQVDTDAQETSRASKYQKHNRIRTEHAGQTLGQKTFTNTIYEERRIIQLRESI